MYPVINGGNFRNINLKQNDGYLKLKSWYFSRDCCTMLHNCFSFIDDINWSQLRKTAAFLFPAKIGSAWMYRIWKPRRRGATKIYK